MTNSYTFSVNHDIKFNYQAGLVMEYKFSPKLAIAPEGDSRFSVLSQANITSNRLS